MFLIGWPFHRTALLALRNRNADRMPGAGSAGQQQSRSGTPCEPSARR